MEKKLSIKKTLLGLKVGEVCTFPPSSLRSVRVMASELGFTQDRKFTVNQVRTDNENFVKVTRI